MTAADNTTTLPTSSAAQDRLLGGHLGDGGDIPAVMDTSPDLPPATLPDSSDTGERWPDPPVLVERIVTGLESVVVGQQRMLERLVVAMLAGGHVLLEGVPGVGKTMTLSALANLVDGSFSRIQFTSDLLPSDIVGTRVYRASTEEFIMLPGPIFANFVLADEINRAPAKVQSALLEVMAERQVTVAGESRKVPDPFLVLATQNPVESEGVFPLPEAQRDRFMMKINVPLPTEAEERAIVNLHAKPLPTVARAVTIDQLRALQRVAESLEVSNAVADYAVRLTMATRDPQSYGVSSLDGVIRHGASPRATIAMIRAARAMAIVRGRPKVTVQDVYDIAFDVLNHRVLLTYDAIADGRTAQEVCAAILKTVPAPRSTK
jgi:MoxR-like ATPase